MSRFPRQRRCTLQSRPITSAPALRIILWGFCVGIVFAVFGGLGFESSGQAVRAGVPPAVTTESIRPVFSPLLAFVAFLVGTMVGALIGVLWRRGRVGHGTAVVLVTLVGGLVGLACAAWFGAETTTTMRVTSIETEHGAPLVVMVTGGVLGIFLGALTAWELTRLWSPRVTPASPT
jgi:hypothetical protein